MASCRNNVQLRGTEEMERKKKNLHRYIVSSPKSRISSFFEESSIVSLDQICPPVYSGFTVLLPFMVILA